MSIQINYKKNNSKKVSNNQILFTDEKFEINSLKKYISKSEFSYINDLLKVNDISKNLFVFELTSKKKILKPQISKI